ncbi:hypothetical protein [Krasilnikoviella flava]|uniref:DUF4386 family protein n=1 Tax=Krasilnikoviella flava TaxID=526729 RepID=A0A1T5ICS1_9MICO|nr:hypothetical protein [Krasilnikoviella flava]SKC36994.1 hypothetical protein SAMN04324258_0346 [Krasilnikoviella flava]
MTRATPAPAARPAAPAPTRSTTAWTVAGASAAGVLLLLFPALRPWPDESVPALALAQAFASDRWVLAHLCGIAGLGLLAPTFLGLRAVLRGRAARTGAATAAVVTAWAGAGLCALYFGAEIFGIRTIAQAALRTGDPTLLAEVDVLREQPAAMTVFGLGLALVAAAGVLAVVATWRGGLRPPWVGIPLAAGLVLYLPQFFGAPAVRVGHGVLVALGLGLLAWAVSRPTSTDTTTAGHPAG